MGNEELLSRYLTKQNDWFTPRLPSREVKQFLKLIPCGNGCSPVLDIGSGPCSDTLYLKQQGISAISFDIDGSPDVYGDLRQTLPFPDCYAKAIICRGVLHILSDVDQIHAIGEMHRILQPWGLFYATFMISIFVDKRHQLITVEDYFGMNLDSYFAGHWRKSNLQNHGDHYHYFGKYIGNKR